MHHQVVVISTGRELHVELHYLDLPVLVFTPLGAVFPSHSPIDLAPEALLFSEHELVSEVASDLGWPAEWNYLCCSVRVRHADQRTWAQLESQQFQLGDCAAAFIYLEDYGVV